MVDTGEEPQAQVERILRSDTFRSTEVLRRLLRFLAAKAFSGEADGLKEYAIGLDALGKPPSYDPRQDATVRLQVARLRQKLAEYYRTEGKDDTVTFDLPKGHFKLIWEFRPSIAPPGSRATPKSEAPAAAERRRITLTVMAAALLAAVAWGSYSTLELWRERQKQGGASRWTPELEQLWRPFISSGRPMMIAIGDPLYVRFVRPSGDEFLLRKRSVSRFEDALADPDLQAIQKVVGNTAMQPAFDHVGIGNLISTFLLGRLLGTRAKDISVTRISQLSLRDLSENNVLLIGSQSLFGGKLLGLPLEPELVMGPAGIQNPKPREGEPSVLVDRVSPAGDGEMYVLISRIPGPVGNTTVESITDNRTSWGNMGAVQFLTDPEFARILSERLRSPSGQIPSYYQVVLKVRCREGVATEISYVLHRVLPTPSDLAGARSYSEVE
jgi:hypothetical protein